MKLIALLLLSLGPLCKLSEAKPILANFTADTAFSTGTSSTSAADLLLNGGMPGIGVRLQNAQERHELARFNNAELYDGVPEDFRVDPTLTLAEEILTEGWQESSNGLVESPETLAFVPVSECEKSFALVTYFANDEQASQGRFLIRSYLDNTLSYPLITLLSSDVSETIAAELCSFEGVTTYRISNEALNAVVRENEEAIVLSLWSLKQFSKIVFISYLKIIQRSLDDLFSLDVDGFAAVEDDFTSDVPKAGLFVISPSKEIHELLWLDYSPATSVQTLLATITPTWMKLDETYNPISRRKNFHTVTCSSVLNIRFLLKIIGFIGQSSREYSKWIRMFALYSLKRFSPPSRKSELRCVDVFTKQRVCTKITPFFCLDAANCIDTKLDQGISLVTQISVDRLSRLHGISHEWSGPISVAIWMHEQDRELLIFNLLQHDMPFQRIAIHFCEQTTSDPYPINVLRNVGMQYAITDMVMVLDADFIMMPRSYETLINNAHSYISQDTKLKHAMVIPAFDFSPQIQCNMEGPMPCVTFPRDKYQLKRKYQLGLVEQFHVAFFKGHGPTDYAKWIQAKNPYYVDWQSNYEPYVIVRKSVMNFTWFNEGYVNRGYNKAIFAFELYVRGFHFTVVPDVFNLHIYESLQQRKDTTNKIYLPFLKEIKGFNRRTESALRKKFNCTQGTNECGDHHITYNRRYRSI